MHNALKSLENNALAALAQRAPNGVVNAIHAASRKTGVSFSYLMEKAAAESSFNPTVKAKTSSATGLFQFINSTWMDMMNKHGAKHGIDTNQSRQDLLELRKNPEIASIMAAEFAQDNKNFLAQNVGGEIGNTELYFAHFMGAGGATAFLSQLKKNPMGIAADIFPREARANRNVFYDRQTGAPKTLQQVYDFFDKKFTGDTEVADARPETMAHQPRKKGAGYQHIPPVLSDRVRIANSNIYARNSLYQVERQLDAFFSQPAATSSLFPKSMYGNLATPTSMILNVLKFND